MTHPKLLAAMTMVALVALLLGGCAEQLGLDDPPTSDVESTEVADTPPPDSTGDAPGDPTAESTTALPPLRPPAEDPPGVYGAANGCWTIEGFDGQREAYLTLSDDGRAFAFSAVDEAAATPFVLRAADLGVYLLYDQDRHFVTARERGIGEEESASEEAGASGSGESGATDASGASDSAPGTGTGASAGGPTESRAEDDGWILRREAVLGSAVLLGIDRYRSSGEWELEEHPRDASRYRLRHGVSGLYLTFGGLAEEPERALVVTLRAAEGCAEFPELTLDAEGEVIPRTWEDGDVFGIVDAHTHLVTNKGFGGGGMFHGAPYHRLGVEHALHDCDHVHGEEGRRDLIGYFYDGGDLDLDVDAILPILADRQTPEFNHHTDGFPTFTDWPNARTSSTHQVQYYRWLERAHRAGLRLVVELATGNSVLCELLTGLRAQRALYSCNDMYGVDRAIEAVREMERYIDAQSAGPGQGWFRIVESPEHAREVIRAGNLAVVLGIETSNLFNCYLSPPPGVEPCTPQSVSETLDRYHAKGVRVIFPVHKYDNAFAPGDGQRGIIELGNLVNSSHYSNFVQDCPLDSHVFDSGGVTFGGINRPRTPYDLPPVLNMFRFAQSPVAALLPLLNRLQEPSLPGQYCQNAGLTPLGEHLLREIMVRGMIVDIAHLPQFAVLEALDLLEEADYPASSTHGDTYGGRIFDIGGFGRISIGRCGNPDRPGSMGDALRNRVALLEERGLYPGAGFAFDFNGFAGGRGPRFGELSSCPQPQENPITYPFRSWAGDVEFTQPRIGDREVDFNTEGMIHVGLLPELIEEARRDGVTDEELEPLFRSAESWLRMWERAEQRASEGF